MKNEIKNSNFKFLKPEFDYFGEMSGFNRSYLKYGHIVRGDNHYQFYFDFEKLVEDKYEEIKKWAKKEWNIEKDAFNIVISPLQITNASFLKIILDNTFGSNLHLLHININETGKENIRTKFSFIAEELKKIHNAYSKVNFYYIDDSICTGAGVARAYKFLMTICSQAQIDLKSWFGGSGAFKFAKVFLLVNRCSYETALTWVNKPNKDWHGFINLCVPSYNTHSNTCPGCKINERYELLRKRSATNELTAYFDGQAKKHVARNPEEYDLWIRDEMFKSSTYFSWLRLWLFYANDAKLQTIVDDKHFETFKNDIDKLKIHINGFYKLKNDKNNWNRKSLKSFYEWCRDGENSDVENCEKIKVFCLELLFYIKSEDNYLRLVTMNEAYQKLIYNKDLNLKLKKEKSTDIIISEIKKIIENMFEKCADIENEYDKAMKRISYIKVISRDYLAKNYYIRAAMQSVLIKLFDEITKSGEVFGESIDKVNIALIYRILKNVIHRLALMRSDYIILRKSIVNIAIAYYVMKQYYSECSDEEKIFATLLSDDDMITDYIASIKTATMEENDDGMCIKLFNSLKRLKQESNENVFKKVVQRLLDKSMTNNTNLVENVYNVAVTITDNLNIENNRMLYDFMEGLSNRCTLGESITEEWKYDGYVGEGGLKERNNLIENLKNEIQKFVGFYNQDEYFYYENFYQNPLSSYVRFYKKIIGIGTNGYLDESELRKITESLNAFNICRFLTEPEFKSKRHDRFESLPYIFEDLCLSIKNMTSSRSCYFVYKKKGELSQLISRSGYVIDNDNNSDDGNYIPLERTEDKFSTIHIGASEFDLIIKRFENKIGKRNDIKLESRRSNITVSMDENVIADGVKIIKSEQKYNSKNSEHTFFVFDIPVKNEDKSEEDKVNEQENSEAIKTKEDNGKRDERHFYIIIENDNIKDRLVIALRVLFLRNRIWESLQKYYSSLLNFRFYVNYIQPINKNETDESITKVMHISDLHLLDDESWNTDGWKLATLCDRLRSLGAIELLAVTGDVINYPIDANDAQRKYKRVANLLFEIAKALWGIRTNNGNVVLPHDWKRRILITTGNHDYAAMNDVRVQTKSRMIETGLPASSSGGTMSRYTYFLEFLSYFLDAPTQRLLKNDLNEVREYKNLGLIIGAFNSCSEANALQNNKISINKEKLAVVLTDSAWYKTSRTALALMHHSPLYPIDYFKDKYEDCRWEAISNFKNLYDSYCLELELRFFPVKRGDSQKELKNFTKLFEDMVKENAFNESELFANFRISQLYADMQMLHDIIQNDIKQPHEFSEQFKSVTISLAANQTEDQNNLNECRTLILGQNINRKVYFLVGHEHRCYYYDNNSTPTYVMNMLYKPKEKTILFEIMEINNGNLVRDINMYEEEIWRNELCCYAHKEFIYKKLDLK